MGAAQNSGRAHSRRGLPDGDECPTRGLDAMTNVPLNAGNGSRELGGKTAAQSCKLRAEIGITREGQMPPVCRVSPVAHVRDPPVGVGGEVDDQVDARTVGTVTFTAAEDDLSLLAGLAELSLGKAELREHRIKRARHRVQLGGVGRRRERSEEHLSRVADRATYRRQSSHPPSLAAG